jgi:enamine deaminase RidA (YjgF/YER057c/UK114 family)
LSFNRGLKEAQRKGTLPAQASSRPSLHIHSEPAIPYQRRAFMKIHRINPTKRWSDITVFNGIAHFVEIADSDTKADIKGQVEQIFAQAEQSLAKINSDKSRILSATIYLTDFANLAALNELWDAWFEEGTAPSRACVKAELANPDYLVEMTFVAAAGESFTQ